MKKLNQNLYNISSDKFSFTKLEYDMKKKYYTSNIKYNKKILKIKTPIINLCSYINYNNYYIFKIIIDDERFSNFINELEGLFKYEIENGMIFPDRKININLFKSFINKDKLEIPTLKKKYIYNSYVKIPIVDGKINCDIVNINNENITLNELEHNSNIKFEMILKNLTFKKNKFYVNWVITKIIFNELLTNEERQKLLDSDISPSIEFYSES
jgi:hypothetical protein